jgi:hypothetical protein
MGCDTNQAEWFISKARKVHLDLLSGALSNKEQTLILYTDILLSSLQLAISNKHQVPCLKESDI